MTGTPWLELFDEYFAETLARVPIIGIFRGLDPQATVRACRTAWDAGVEMVEIPVSSRGALASLDAAVEAGRERGRAVGAGSVISVELLEASVRAGARFSVAPGVDLDVIRASARLGVPHLPGVATASDITAATREGLRWVKVFPASLLGTEWIRAMSGPFPESRFVATGGITSDNAVDFLRAGAGAVALGSALSANAVRAIVDRIVARQ